jgi:hypothetical protein
VEIELSRFVLITLATLAAATSGGFAQRAPPASAARARPAPPSLETVTQPLVAAIPTSPARNAIGLPAPSPAANNIGALRGPGRGGPKIDAAKPGSVSIGGIHSDIYHAQVVPLTAKGARTARRWDIRRPARTCSAGGRHACAPRSDRPQCLDKALIGSLSSDQSIKVGRSLAITTFRTPDDCHLYQRSLPQVTVYVLLLLHYTDNHP